MPEKIILKIKRWLFSCLMAHAGSRTKTKLHHHNFPGTFLGRSSSISFLLRSFLGRPVPARHHQRTSPPPISQETLSRKTKPGQNQTLMPLLCCSTLSILSLLWAHSCSVTADGSIEGIGTKTETILSCFAFELEACVQPLESKLQNAS